MSSKWLSKPSKIRPGSDPEPYQKIDDFLEGPPGALATNNTTPLHQIWSGKGEEMERDMPKTPSFFLGKIGGLNNYYIPINTQKILFLVYKLRF